MGQLAESQIANTENARTAAFRRECRDEVKHLKPAPGSKVKTVNVRASVEAHDFIKSMSIANGTGITEALDEIIAEAQPAWTERQALEVGRIRGGM